ncbi:EF-hand domain-containing protein [Sphingomonas qilianensis]|uniref:EF-hand domain-containing protein n=1 Tax=Sphingomonas qilianensis TaxID=1736690 RepID=A0ABU9XQ07_9SPHN
MMLLAALLFAAVQQPAPPVPGAQPQPFASIVAEPAALLIAACDEDGDGDAVVTRVELHACLARSFAGVAQGKPDIGYIGYGDWALRWLGDANALPSQYGVDTDNDDRITLAELTTEFDRLFDRYDVDKNGTLTRAELLTIRSAIPPRPPGKRK